MIDDAKGFLATTLFPIVSAEQWVRLLRPSLDDLGLADAEPAFVQQVIEDRYVRGHEPLPEQLQRLCIAIRWLSHPSGLASIRWASWVSLSPVDLLRVEQAEDGARRSSMETALWCFVLYPDLAQRASAISAACQKLLAFLASLNRARIEQRAGARLVFEPDYARVVLNGCARAIPTQPRAALKLLVAAALAGKRVPSRVIADTCRRHTRDLIRDLRKALCGSLKEGKALIRYDRRAKAYYIDLAPGEISRLHPA